MQLAYADEGPGPPVVLLHGFPLSREMWAEQLSALGSTYRVIAPDLRGHGESPAPEGTYTMDDMADDVIELLNRLHIDVPIVLGGLSMGGYVALSLVAQYPKRVRALMLLDTRAGADTPEAAANRETTARAALEANSAAAVVAVMVPKLFCKKTLEERPERVEPLRSAMERTTARGIAGALRGMAVRPDRRGDLARIAVPTLVLVGQEDVITPPAESRTMADAIPNARFQVIPDAGHLAPYENYAAANSVILEFLKGLRD
jgi:pimeloyl-ACP methyl ester carboxylesterase